MDSTRNKNITVGSKRVISEHETIVAPGASCLQPSVPGATISACATISENTVIPQFSTVQQFCETGRSRKYEFRYFIERFQAKLRNWLRRRSVIIESLGSQQTFARFVPTPYHLILL